ncbi:MAG: hypothetical protein ACK4ZJ_18985, partial [Allorhizobium sp.]
MLADSARMFRSALYPFVLEFALDETRTVPGALERCPGALKMPPTALSAGTDPSRGHADSKVSPAEHSLWS